MGHDGGYRHRFGAFRVDETPEAGQALYLVLRATDGPGWEDPGAVSVGGANALGRPCRAGGVRLLGR